MSDHERGPEDDEEETTPAATIMIPHTHTHTQTPTHVFVHNRVGGKEDDVPKVPPELDIFEDLSELNPGYVYKHMEKLDTDKQAYGWLPLMASSSGGQIGALCAESFCEHILSEANDVCHERNTLLDTRKRSTCWLCLVWIKNSCNTCMKSTPSWVVKISTKN